MVKLEKINETIKTIEGIPVILTGDSKSLTFKRAFVMALEISESKPGESIPKIQLGGRIHSASDKVELTEEDIKILKDCVDNLRGFPSVVTGNLGIMLRDAKK